ncbi:ABC transporter ATP-binding protein [bacterium]|nr:ABC transporter ATP-binding protein [bacterium]MBU1884502.1 ABC transporter ATP-binding protein [bacterium]
MNKNIAIKVQGLTKIYKLYNKPIDRLKESLHPFQKKYHKDFYALNNVSFEIKKGETVGIVGKNGSGKSTLLKLITGVTTPTGGRISVHGKISAILELGAGFNPEMTGLENVYLNTSINGLSKKETDEKLTEIVEFSELNEFINQPMKTYSSGMKAKLAFSVAISMKPDILIVDEALSVGDAAFKRKCYVKMEEIRESGATILFVSHSEHQILHLCSRALLFKRGVLIAEDIPKTILHFYNNDAIPKHINSKQSFLNDMYTLHATDYDRNLQSNSRISYDKLGCEILDISILTIDAEEKVNILEQGNRYKIKMQVHFHKTLHNVKFGFMINTLEGFKLGGLSYPSVHKNVDVISEGETKIIEWEFDSILKQETYFMTAAVTSIENGTFKFAHRISDALIFRILGAKDNKFTGYVNFDQRGE